MKTAGCNGPWKFVGQGSGPPANPPTPGPQREGTIEAGAVPKHGWCREGVHKKALTKCSLDRGQGGDLVTQASSGLEVPRRLRQQKVDPD